MSHLPVIVGYGGINPAGRSSCLHGYRRLVIDKLSAEKSERTFRSLSALMNLDGSDLTPEKKQHILDHTLIRKMESNLFDPLKVRHHKSAQLLSGNQEPIRFKVKNSQLPEDIPVEWLITELEAGSVEVVVPDNLDVLFLDPKNLKVNAAGQLPSGFDPETLYQSRNHPRGLQLTVYGASDAINSLGIDWQQIRSKVPGDQISVYASSAMGQLDYTGSGGLFQAPLTGRRVSSKNCALGLVDMTADFVNAYILGNVGSTGANVGACATFLYNLRQGIADIRSGKYRVVVVGSSEAPLLPEIMEGYRTMGALADDEKLIKLDCVASGDPDYRRACRPFSTNCGFTLAEASQFIVLFDDELAVETGANIYGSVADVFVNADGFKKSIPGPGIGNYATMGKATGVIRSMFGDKVLQNGTYVQAHGTGTPQNRVTESHIINEIAKTFGIENWPVAAIKSYVGHSIASASGDQMIAAIGAWQDGIIPGITTIDHLADDVHHTHVNYLRDHMEIDPQEMVATLINAKGFGGNNASGVLISPHATKTMLAKKHGKKALGKHAELNENVQEKIAAYDDATINGVNSLIYNFGEGVIEGEELHLTKESISIPGHEQDLDINVPNPYDDMT